MMPSIGGSEGKNPESEYEEDNQALLLEAQEISIKRMNNISDLELLDMQGKANLFHL